MKKSEELKNPDSCLNKAYVDEVLFVLLGRDAAAPATIRKWVETRILLGLNKRNDPKIVEALQTAWEIESYHISMGELG